MLAFKAGYCFLAGLAKENRNHNQTEKQQHLGSGKYAKQKFLVLHQKVWFGSHSYAKNTEYTIHLALHLFPQTVKEKARLAIYRLTRCCFIKILSKWEFVLKAVLNHYICNGNTQEEMNISQNSSLSHTRQQCNMHSSLQCWHIHAVFQKYSKRVTCIPGFDSGGDE